MRNSCFAAITALCLFACGETQAPDDQPGAFASAREDTPGLTQNYAELRAAQLDKVRYALSVTLDPVLDNFSGENKIEFELLDNASDLTIDFSGGDVAFVGVNGVRTRTDYNDAFISIPATALRLGHNEVEVRFSHQWSDDGSGLYRYKDPDDGETYLYSDFEPYDANRAFPLFDQPDVKARFSLSVTAPAEWQGVSASRETNIKRTAETTRTWSFAETLPLPTYVVSLHAGPYVVWEDEDFRIPMRLFARKSMADLVEPDVNWWFEITRAGLDFFEDYYGIDYPYHKYDHLLVPDFNSDAMENAAAVTYTERSHIQRDGWSYSEKKWHIEVILHEMAHQWFGDLVTMKWWNDLWLNETFAEFMGYHAAAAKFGIDDAWESFFLDRKYYAYWIDQRSTTHPVETFIPDTNSIKGNFDMIAYAKGAAVLRQIEFRLGRDAFQRGIRSYLKRHAEGNATREDFIAALSDASGTDLGVWANEWLSTAGANTIEAQFDCEGGIVTDFSLAQSAPDDYPILRMQKVQVGLFRDRGDAVVVDAVLPITFSGAQTPVPDAIGKACPDLVYPNYGDYGYLLVRLDSRTRNNLNSMIGRIDDTFQRAMFWQTLWDNVRFAQIPISDYLDAVLRSAATEDDLNNVDQIYGFVGSAIRYLRHMQDKGADTLAQYQLKLEATTWSNVMRTQDDLQTMYLDRYLSFVSSNDGLENLIGILAGDVEIPGRDIDQDRRWTMLQVLSREGHEGINALLDTEKHRDPSDDGRRRMIAIEAAQPDLAVKRKIIADVLNIESENSYALQRIAMRAMLPTGQEQLSETLAGEVLAQILDNEKHPDPAFYSRAAGFTYYLIPANCTEESVNRLRNFMTQLETDRPAIRRIITERYEDDVLCLQRAALLN